ncbi:hypothetical protein OPT61_g3951 [Boeremia exigua]|uniref:Uncharacterized protein n=1 Tax=Boeremia exigua TaxID=749465 RepID=A0ACC2IG50_9PLEO|nr:hypothetical protein OPT61_g3951 [Boeremia exigua]
MSAPLVDIDANPRQPALRLTEEGSKIPSLTKAPRSGSASRRSPFSVSTTGSPCYTALSVTTKAVMSPAHMSRLPRKSTPTQNTASRYHTDSSRLEVPRLSLPRAQDNHRPNAIAGSYDLNTSKITSPLGYNKPLPSPPVAQIVNATSPPKAQRTLVDAEAGTPTDEQWPILRPEFTPSSKSPGLSAINQKPQRSVSEGLASRHNHVSVLKGLSMPSFVDNHAPFEKSGITVKDTTFSNENFNQTPELRDLSCRNPSAHSFHAVSTNTKVAIDSPLAHTERSSPGVMIPPRVSSKRNSLPSPRIATFELPVKTPCTQPVKEGSTKWPVLGDTTDQIDSRNIDDEGPSSSRHLITESGPDELAWFEGADMTPSHYGLIDGVASRGLSAGSSIGEDAEAQHDGGFRVKRLSWRSPNSGSGPILRIFADADAVLLGQDGFNHATPDLRERVPEHDAAEHPPGTFTGRISKHNLVKTDSTTALRTSTPSSAVTESAESQSIKITPIRSMQPPRDLSTGDLSGKSASSDTQAAAEVTNNPDVLISSQKQHYTCVETLRRTSLSRRQSDETLQTAGYVSCLHDQVKTKPTVKQASNNYSATVQDGATLKPLHVCGESSPSLVTPQSPKTYATPSPTRFHLPEFNVVRNDTSPLLQSSERLKARSSLLPARPTSQASSSVARSNRSQVHASNKGTQAAKQSGSGTTLKVRAKRSFRNIFNGRGPSAAPQPVKKPESKRSSVAGSALAQRIRQSTNFSKISLARPSESKSEIKRDVVSPDGVQARDTDDKRQTALYAQESSTAMVAQPPEPTLHYDTATVIHEILGRVTSMGEDSPDRLRGLEIAEAILHTFECSQASRVSAELARKYACDAELNADRAGVELKRLEKLCGPSFDDKTMQAIKQVIAAASTSKDPEASSKQLAQTKLLVLASDYPYSCHWHWERI